MDDRRRAVIDRVQPVVGDGRFPIKRVCGEPVIVEADIFTDGHEAIAADLLVRHRLAEPWQAVAMQPIGVDRWRGEFTIDEPGPAWYTLRAWTDPFATWLRDLRKRQAAGQALLGELAVGSALIEAAADRATTAAATQLRWWADQLLQAGPAASELAGDAALSRLMRQWADQRLATEYTPALTVTVEPPLARFSAWYELFPRSASPEPGRHGTLADVERRLPAIAALGFDVVYLPPIHPIGRTNRKGRNGALVAGPDDPGSPWAIGAAEGGHDAIHPQLGTLNDFHSLIRAAERLGLAIALDLAFQCSPDHPYVSAQPSWFRHRPDGSIRFAENPPKQYQDIYPLDFESDDWCALWTELRRVVLFWIAQGVTCFRVDNPHTKPFSFWAWLIASVKAEYPEVIFLSEAFTRPRVMEHLARLGFSQSYTYFTWRTSKRALTDYLTELTQTERQKYLRPNFWPNTPDILTEQLQTGGRPAFVSRLILAATLAASYGIYGPAYEQLVDRPREPGSEEYLDSEKYQLHHWPARVPGDLSELVARLNRIRRANPALHDNRWLRFHPIDNEQLIAYSKRSPDGENIILAVVNLDPFSPQSGWLELPLADFGLAAEASYQLHDLLTDARYLWHGPRAFVRLDPAVVPAHLFRLRRWQRSERDFDYFD